MDRTVNVIENLDGKKTVIIQDIRFRGKRNINWTDVFHASLLIRHAADGRKYLYDIIEIKKETGKCCQE